MYWATGLSCYFIQKGVKFRQKCNCVFPALARHCCLAPPLHFGTLHFLTLPAFLGVRVVWKVSQNFKVSLTVMHLTLLFSKFLLHSLVFVFGRWIQQLQYHSDSHCFAVMIMAFNSWSYSSCHGGDHCIGLGWCCILLLQWIVMLSNGNCNVLDKEE